MSVPPVTKCSLAEIKDILSKGEISPVSLKDQMLNRIEETKNMNIYISVNESIEDVKDSFERIRNKKARALEGIPISIKDLYCIKNERTTAGSYVLKHYIPNYTATVVQKSLDAGAINMGKTNLDEFAMGSTTQNPTFGTTLNPLNSDYLTGGSSGGSAASVAAGTCFAAIGSDTGGSVRLPASFCGLVGARPSYGRCSRFGMIAFSSSFDQPGVITRTVEDCSIVLEQMIGHDERDMTTVKKEVPKLNFDTQNFDTQDIQDYKIGFFDCNPAQCLQNRWKHILNDLQTTHNIQVNSVEVDCMNWIIPLYYTLTSAEAFSNLMKYDGIEYGIYNTNSWKNDNFYENYRELFGEEIRRRIMTGAYILSAEHYQDYYIKAKKLLSHVRREFAKIFEDVDALIIPTTFDEALRITQKFDNPTEVYEADKFTVVAPLANLPSISIPVGVGQTGMPISIQVLTKSFDETTMFKIARFIEKWYGKSFYAKI